MSSNQTDARTKVISSSNPAGVLLEPNENRVGVLIYNNTGTIVTILLDENRDADGKHFSYAIPQRSIDTTLHDISVSWKGRITFFIDNAASGAIHVTEFTSLKEC